MDGVTLLVGWGFLGAFILVAIAFAYARNQKRIDVIDAFWGLAILTAVLVAAWQTRPLSPHSWLVIALVGVWALRLSHHIGKRFERSKAQDERYTELTKKWRTSAYWLSAFTRVYLVQALLATIVALSPIIVVAADKISQPWLAVGLVVWCVGFVMEVLADSELKEFIKNSNNGVLSTGLWRYSRHPNYFGELVMWWGIWVASLGTSNWLVALASPLVLTILIVWVSGVPPAERRAAARKGWKEYKQKTSVLIPLPRK